METRLLVAYGLIVTIGVALLAASVVIGRRRAQRKRRLRGIKTDEIARAARRSAP